MRISFRPWRAALSALAMLMLFSRDASAQKVLLLAADMPELTEDVRAKLAGTGLLTTVDVIDVSVSTPTLATLLNYDVILTWSDEAYGDDSALGDVLADYVDQGHGVVQAAFSLFPTDSLSLAGRWHALGYEPFSFGDIAGDSGLTLVPVLPLHAILVGVLSFDGGTSSLHHTGLTLASSAELVAQWSNGQPMVVTRTGPHGGRIVGLNLYPPSSDARADLWNAATDGARLMANALVFAAAPSDTNHAPTASAGFDQTIEATGPAGASFTLTGAGTDADSNPLAFAWSGAATGSGQTLSVTLPPPGAPAKMQTYSVKLTVSDGQGGAATDDVSLTVTDTTGPVLSNLPPSIVTATATSAAGAAVAYGPIAAVDAVDGSRPVVCSASGVFPIGDTAVTCAASDTRANTSTATFTVRVLDVTTRGRMWGAGIIRQGSVGYGFEFNVSEGPIGQRARLELFVEARARHIDHFTARTTDFVAFSDNPAVRPSRSTLPQVDTVLFSGAGEWNGHAGYHYEVFAVDQGDRRHGSVRITITGPGGAIVAKVEGVVSLGEVQSIRQ